MKRHRLVRIGLVAFGLLALALIGQSIESGFAVGAICLAAAPLALTEEQVREFKEILDGFKGYEGIFKELAEMAKAEGGLAAIRGLPAALKAEQKRNDDLAADLKKLRKQTANFQSSNGVRWVRGVPFVTDECAKSITGVFILECAKLAGALENLIRDPGIRQRVLDISSETLGFATTKAALDATSTPLPTVYVPQVVELVWQYGQARQFATVYPLGAGLVKLPRLKTGEDDFAYLGAGTAGMSQTVNEKKVSAELVTFTANKMGGLIRIPTEIEEDTFIPLGQFLARYIARQLAKIEDKTLFLGDGTSTYASQTGVGPYCSGTPYWVQLGTGKTKPSDATISDFRSIRAKVNAAVLVDDPAYYMNPTMEALLVTFNTLNQPLIYRPAMGGQPATLDGFPIRWVGVMQPYTTSAAAGTYLTVFGSLKHWYLGERGAPRIEVSREVFFATDEIAMRALERIDVEAMAVDAMSALQTAAS
jgi:HK97 family phage major capsid protein